MTRLQSDLVATIPRPLGVRGAAIYALAVFETPFDIPLVEIKQVWLRNLVAEMSQNKPSL